MSYSKSFCFCLAITTMLFLSTNVSAESAHRLGAGLNYWYALDDIDVDNIDDKGVSYLLSYQYIPSGLFKIEADLGITKEGYAGSDDLVLSPQIYLLAGKSIYGGIGIGINYSNGEFAKEPFYALRAGFDLELLPSIFLDINANYRFENWNSDAVREDIDTDTITLGACIRVEL